MPSISCDYFNEAAGRFVCDFVERLPTTDTGKPFSLYEWQRSAIMEFYGSMERDDETGEWLRKYWYLYLEIPKKNGKSELAAALGIYHLFADGELNAEVYVCAADKDNAGIISSLQWLTESQTHALLAEPVQVNVLQRQFPRAISIQSIPTSALTAVHVQASAPQVLSKRREV